MAFLALCLSLLVCVFANGNARDQPGTIDYRTGQETNKRYESSTGASGKQVESASADLVSFGFGYFSQFHYYFRSLSVHSAVYLPLALASPPLSTTHTERAEMEIESRDDLNCCFS